MAELVEHLGINWKLLIASIVNFFLLFFILRKYAYGPILGMLEKREKTIAQSVKQSQAIEQAVKDLEERKANELREARAEASRLLEKAARNADAIKAEAVQAASAEATKLIAKAKTELASERAALKQSVMAEVADLVVRATEKVLKEKMTGDVDRRLAEQAVAQVEKRRP